VDAQFVHPYFTFVNIKLGAIEFYVIVSDNRLDKHCILLFVKRYNCLL